MNRNYFGHKGKQTMEQSSAILESQVLRFLICESLHYKAVGERRVF